MGKFTATIDEFIAKSQKRLIAVQRESTKRVINIAQLSDDKGGRMRVDTGFLRASGQLSLNGMPTGPIRPADDAISNDPRYVRDKDFASATSPIALTLAGSTLNNTLYFGWTAEYAKYREWHDGFLKMAVQQWPQIVNEVVKEVRARINR